MERLSHSQIAKIVTALGDAKIVNLDASIRSLIQPIDGVMRDAPGSSVSLHILCCNEYALVTNLTGGPLGDIRDQAESVRSALSRS